MNISKRVGSVDVACAQFKSRTETCLHVIRGCGWVDAVWEGLRVDVRGAEGYEMVRDWMEEAGREMDAKDWVMFMVRCWALWERRNKVLFEEEVWRADMVVQRVREVLWEMSDVVGTMADPGACVVAGWARPERGKVKINVDAGVKEGVGTSWGIVCRDADGKMLWGATIQARVLLHPTLAEAMAILYGLQEAASRGIRRLIVEEDCEVVIEDLKKKRTGSNDIFLVYYDNLNLCRRFDDVSFSFIRRSLNKVAHEFAHVLPWEEGRRSWEGVFPPSIVALAEADLSNT
ncbi:uncharacterized protein LOC141620226 [Silene latifolia]|uniref:uncharacterized protein LOC141620226 n=1 Tax=Silene latifolia TaxID=37657 RepID=UPI003D776EA1